MDLPVWQAIRSELHSKGLEIVTVALDVNPAAARRVLDAVNLDHPSLIDSAHIVDELLGMVNVPNGVWIDEEGIIVRPAEPAQVDWDDPRFRDSSPMWRDSSGQREDSQSSPGIPDHARDMVAEAAKLRYEGGKYHSALRDWVEEGKDSRYVLSPDQVIERSGTRGFAEATAAARFELGHYLWRSGREDLAPYHWREAHRLQPDNWTYKRQAWSLADPLQRQTELYDSNWLTETRKVGTDNYYPPLKMDD